MTDQIYIKQQDGSLLEVNKPVDDYDNYVYVVFKTVTIKNLNGEIKSDNVEIYRIYSNETDAKFMCDSWNENSLNALLLPDETYTIKVVDPITNEIKSKVIDPLTYEYQICKLTYIKCEVIGEVKPDEIVKIK